MNIAVAYVYPLSQLRKWYPLAVRFADSYGQFPAGYPHELHILCNGGLPSGNEIKMFDRIKPKFHYYDNTGWDIGAFQKFADLTTCDLLVCMGAYTHFHRSGWMEKIVDAYLDSGPGLYGCAAYLSPNWHVRTTTFWCPPEILRSYPAYIGTSRQSRYEFEHGNTSFTRHVLKLGFPCRVVCWDGCWPFDQWHDHAPDHRNILIRDQHIHA